MTPSYLIRKTLGIKDKNLTFENKIHHKISEEDRKGNRASYILWEVKSDTQKKGGTH